MSRILSVAHTPPTQVELGSTVAEAVAAMVGNRVGATAVVEGGHLRGIFTERDLMTKVVKEGQDPTTTKIDDVMTTAVDRLAPEDAPSQAFRVMTKKHFRHMPICDADGKVLGILSIRDLLYHHVEKLADEMETLEAFITADGPGG